MICVAGAALRASEWGWEVLGRPGGVRSDAGVNGAEDAQPACPLLLVYMTDGFGDYSGYGGLGGYSGYGGYGGGRGESRL